MSSIQPRGSRWQLRVVHELLPKPFFSTFGTESEARAYGATLEDLLDRGMVPVELLEQSQTRSDATRLSKIITAYLANSNIAPSDWPVLALISKTEGDTKLSDVNATWADLWVSRLKEIGRAHV